VRMAGVARLAWFIGLGSRRGGFAACWPDQRRGGGAAWAGGRFSAVVLACAEAVSIRVRCASVPPWSGA